MSVIDVLRSFAALIQTPSTVDETLSALESYSGSLVNGLNEALTTDDVTLQLLALQIVQEIGPKAMDVVPTIVGKLGSDDRCVQTAAASALGAIGPPAEDALPHLQQMLDSNDECVRFVAAGSVLRIEEDNSRALAVVRDVLNDESSPHRVFAAAVLGELGCNDAVPHLKRLLGDGDPGVRSEASLAIWRITGDRTHAESVGQTLLDDPDWLARQIGVEHFHELRGHG